MRLSRFYAPMMKDTPQEAQIISHRLMVRAGLIGQATSGIYYWLPLGKRVLDRLCAIIRHELDRVGCHEVLLPTLQPAELWQKSGRYDAYGPEMLRILDRHDRELVYTPTAEEMMADMARKTLKSYKELPQTLYQIQWKFRDEIRPRFGVMRGREFYMKDAYSFDIDEESSRTTYQKMFQAYTRIFARMGLSAIPVQAPTGPIGGTLSHEFHVVAQTGESQIFYDHRFDQVMETLREGGRVDADYMATLYAREEEMHHEETCPLKEDEIRSARGIEVGHIFSFGTKYAESMGAYVTHKKGHRVPLHMGSYGIGVSRLVGAIIEASHDESGLIWPESVAPYFVGLVNLRQGDAACDAKCEEIYQLFQKKGIPILYDDRSCQGGEKFATMDLLGLPWQVRIGPKTLAQQGVEVKCRRNGMVQILSSGSALAQMKARYDLMHSQDYLQEPS